MVKRPPDGPLRPYRPTYRVRGGTVAQTNKKSTVAFGAVGVAFAGIVGHLTGALHGVEEELPGIRALVSHSDSWSSAASTLKDFNRGDLTQRAVAKATCTFANSFIYERPDTATIKAGIWTNLGVSPVSPEAHVYSPLVTKAANVIYLAEQNGGLAYNYTRICLFPSGS